MNISNKRAGFILLTICTTLTFLTLAGCFTQQEKVTPPIEPGQPPATNVIVAISPVASNLFVLGQIAAETTPPPIGTAIGALLAVVSLALELARRKKQAELNTALKMLDATIYGIEEQGTKEVKKAVQNYAVKSEVQTKLSDRLAAKGF